MTDVFTLRDSVIGDYHRFIAGILRSREPRIRAEAGRGPSEGALWPALWLSLSPKPSVEGTFDDLAELPDHGWKQPPGLEDPSQGAST